MDFSCVMRLLFTILISFTAIISTVEAQNDSLSGFTLLPTNITARLSFPARFDCQTAEGFVRWAVGFNQVLSESNCIECETLVNGSLYIPSVTPAHSGVYTCFIFGGTFQSDSTSVYLTITVEDDRCDNLQPPANGDISSCSSGRAGVGYEGGTCSFTCNTGYELTGSDIRTCQSDGSWSGSDIICSGIDMSTMIPMITTKGSATTTTTTIISTTTATDESVSNTNSSSGGGAIFGGVVGGVILLLIITVILCILTMYVRKSRRRKSSLTNLRTDITIKCNSSYVATKNETTDYLYTNNKDSDDGTNSATLSSSTNKNKYNSIQLVQHLELESTGKIDTDGISTGDDGIIPFSTGSADTSVQWSSQPATSVGVTDDSELDDVINQPQCDDVI